MEDKAQRNNIVQRITRRNNQFYNYVGSLEFSILIGLHLFVHLFLSVPMQPPQPLDACIYSMHLLNVMSLHLKTVLSIV